jgi:hypothetical protein
MHQHVGEGLRHGSEYSAGLQPAGSFPDWYLGLRPRLAITRAFSPRNYSSTSS